LALLFKKKATYDLWFSANVADKLQALDRD